MENWRKYENFLCYHFGKRIAVHRLANNMNPTIVFDIETIPDIAGLRVLHGLDARVSDAEVAEMAFQLRRQKTGSDFLPHHLQRVVAISCALREGDGFRGWSLGGG